MTDLLPTPGTKTVDFGDPGLKRPNLGAAVKRPVIKDKNLLPEDYDRRSPKILYFAPTYQGHKDFLPQWMGYVAQDATYHIAHGWECDGMLITTDDWPDAKRTFTAVAERTPILKASKGKVRIGALEVDTPKRRLGEKELDYVVRKIAAQRARAIEFCRDHDYDALYQFDDDVLPRGADDPNRPGPSAFRLFKWSMYPDVGMSSAVVAVRLNPGLRAQIVKKSKGRRAIAVRAPITPAGIEQAKDPTCDYVEVDGVGLGCAMTFRNALAVDMPDPDEFEELGARGEDFAYTTAIRMSGLQIILDKTVRAWHFEQHGNAFREV